MKENRLGFWSIVLLGMNAIIGSGIFLLPGKVTELVGEWSVGVYAAATLIALSIVWCFATCATRFDRNGGAYLYAKEAFGEFIGFEVGLMRWAVSIIAWSAMVMGFITALNLLWPGALQEPYRSTLVVALVGGLGFLNYVGVNLFKQVNNVVTTVKVFLLTLFALFGLALTNWENQLLPSSFESFAAASFGSAVLLIFYAFSGFEALVVAAGEMENPKKNLPKAVITAVVCCSFLYFFIQISAMGLLGSRLAGSHAPLADAAEQWFGPFGKLFIVSAMLVSIGGINLASSFLAPRSGEALAEDGFVPRFIAKKSRFGTPVWAICITCVLTIALALSGSFVELAVISVISRFAQYFTTSMAVWVFQAREKTGRSWIVTLIPAVAIAAVCWLLSHATLHQVAWGMGALVAGVPLYGYHWLRQRKSVIG